MIIICSQNGAHESAFNVKLINQYFGKGDLY